VALTGFGLTEWPAGWSPTRNGGCAGPAGPALAALLPIVAGLATLRSSAPDAQPAP